jgi:tRNA-specific 2-thiouridylase
MKIAVAMSGGVDSSVAAALLKAQGHEVIGLMLRLWSEPGREGSNKCCTPDSVALARRTAAQLDIPFYVLDAKEEFRTAVVQMFLEAHIRGETPNPCLECNRRIRWTFLLEHAVALGAERLATGHYARLDHDGAGKIRLLRAVDVSKDQSYVLHVMNQDQLQRAVLPLGTYTKRDVRILATKFSLPTASRHDSQDLCFVAGGNYRDFLRRHAPGMMIPGAIVDQDGNILGEHPGLASYTIGQRKALHVSSPVPLYVIRKDIAENRLVVGQEEELGADSLTTGEVNWLAGEPMSKPFYAGVKTRYTALEQPALVTPIECGQRVHISFDEKQRDITPGQAAVFYSQDVVLGGGIIL